MNSCRESYLNGRAELGRSCLALLEGLPEKEHILSHVFWENLWCDEEGGLHSLFYDPVFKGKQNVQSFDEERPPEITRRGPWLRLEVTENWVLEMGKFGSLEGWFEALSGKTRKKLRWLRNALPREGISIIPVSGREGFASFEELYASQFPKHARGGAGNEGVRRIYEAFESQGRNFSFLLRTSTGETVAANLGYINGDSFNFTHLTRKSSELDKYSPGFFLTYKIVEMLYAEHPEVKFFFMGPGKYDYKPAFLARPLPVYRYVKNTFWNLPERLRLRFRLRKELKRRGAE